MNKEELDGIQEMTGWNKQVLIFSLMDPLNRHCTRVEHNCDDWGLYAHPEWLVGHFVENGGLDAFLTQHPNQKNTECPNSDKCSPDIKARCGLRFLNYYWTKCVVHKYLKCTGLCPTEDEIALKREQRRKERISVPHSALCNEAYNIAEIIIFLTCPNNRAGALQDHGKQNDENGEAILARNLDWLSQHFVSTRGKDDFRGRRPDFSGKICDAYEVCGIGSPCQIKHIETGWEKCPLRKVKCNGNCTAD